MEKKNRKMKVLALLLGALLIMTGLSGCRVSGEYPTDGEDMENTQQADGEDVSAIQQDNDNGEDDIAYTEFFFRSEKLLKQHYEKHGIDMGFPSAEEYEKAASDVINNPDALYKEEAEDGDGVYYVESTNEFAVLSTDGYIRTYFLPDAGKSYFDRQ